MPVLAVSIVNVLEVVGFGAAGFLVVALVCAGVLAMLQAILPSADSGAAALDAKYAEAPDAEQPEADDPETPGAANPAE